MLLTAKFHNLVEIFEMELHLPVKLAHKLTHKVLNPGPIDRQSVQHAQAVFHESTVNALHYYGSSQNRPDFLETAKFLLIILTWWKNVNVKSKFKGVRSRDAQQDPVMNSNLNEKTR